MKQAVMYGGGNIGRGFIGALFSQSGYEVTFIDVVDAVVNELKEKRCYPLRYVSTEGHTDVTVEHVTAVNGNDTEAAAQVIADCDIMATAVGARILPFIAPNIAAGIRKRMAQGGEPLNIIICENLMDADKVLCGLVKEKLSEEECAWMDENVGLIEASIGRMVPVQTDAMRDGEPLRVCVEKYGFLPVGKDAFKGEIPEIKNLVPYSPFGFYIRRKLFIHNMGHATCAYLGGLKGCTLIAEAAADPDIRLLAQNAMTESAMALAREYDAPLEDILWHITDLLHRFDNTALGDTCARVGQDPARKLAESDRLIGSALLALKHGIRPCYIAVGAAAGLVRYINEAEGLEQSEETAAGVLRDVSNLPADSELAGMILSMYRRILDGADAAALRIAANEAKAAGMQDIV